tara:strand:- start:239 stop:496 length:258 start_codon:yes stop_codon:yes gene_type:complete
MTDTEYLNIALAKMHSGQWFGFSSKDQSYETLIVHDSSITKPTEDEVNAKIQELKDAETQKANDKTSAQNKLKELGLTDSEIEAL